jgi:hypothetical protein
MFTVRAETVDDVLSIRIRPLSTRVRSFHPRLPIVRGTDGCAWA